MVLNDYVKLFPGFSRDKVRFMQMSEAILQQVVDLQNVIWGITFAYSLDYSEGENLDLFGQIAMVERENGWTDSEYRKVIKRKMELYKWDGTNKSVPQYLSEGDVFDEKGDMTILAQAEEEIPVDVSEWFPVPVGIHAAESL